MSIRKILLILLCSLWLSACAQKEAVLHTANGEMISANELKGKWVIINYWAAWCASCVKEMPALNQFYLHNRTRNIVVYGVNYESLTLSDLQEAIRKVGIKFPVLLENPSSVWRLSEIDVIPTTFIINPQGRVVKKIVGPSTEESLNKILQDVM
jgi:peroxiredoxin